MLISSGLYPARAFELIQLKLRYQRSIAKKTRGIPIRFYKSSTFLTPENDINPLKLGVAFLYPQKTSKTLRVSDVFRGYWKAIPSCNGLRQKCFNKSLKWIQRYLFGLIIPEPNLVPKWLICPTWEPTSFWCTLWYLSYYQIWKKLLGQS